MTLTLSSSRFRDRTTTRRRRWLNNSSKKPAKKITTTTTTRPKREKFLKEDLVLHSLRRLGSSHRRNHHQHHHHHTATTLRAQPYNLLLLYLGTTLYPHQHQSPSLPPPPPPPTTAADIAQRNAILRRVTSTPSVGFGHLPSGPLPFPNTDIGNRWQVISNLNHQVQPSNHLLLTYLPNMNIAYDTRPLHPPQNVIIQRPPQVHKQPSPSSLVNVTPLPLPPPTTSSTPPLITYHQIAGMKRPYPFSLDPSNPSLPSKLPQMVAPGVKTLDQSGSGVPGSVGNAEMSNLVFREGSSTPNPKVTGRENGGQNRDFLILAPSRTASSTLDNREIVNLESPSFQGSVGQPDHPPGPSDRQKSLYNFFPPNKAETTSEETARSTGGSKEAGEKLDLSLKL